MRAERSPGRSGPTGLRLWWELARPFSLTAAVVPVATGTAFAVLDGEFAAIPFLAMLLAAVLIQAGTNMFNEYYDHRRGIDTAESVGIAGAIVRAGMSPSSVLSGALLCFVAALVLGLVLTIAAGWPVLAAGALSAAAAFAYSGGPLPISSTPFGEAEVAVFMGPVIVLLAYFVQAETLAWDVAYASMPIAALVAAILLANNVRDMASDAERGRRTLPIVVGRDRGVAVLRALLYAPYGAVALGAAVTLLPPPALLTLATFPMAREQVRRARQFVHPAELNAAVRGTAALHARFGVLLASGVFAWAPFG